ncbi:MAG: type I secretion C-terminal target domain-containing protein [Pseudomonadota bacterium]
MLTTGAPIGFNNNDGTWTLTPSNLANIGLISAPGTNGTVTLTLTTIATENDGDVATSSTTFDVEITPGAGGGPVVSPLPPIVTVNPMSVNEDGSIALDIDVQADPADPSVPAPTISVTLTGIPADAQVAGAFFNPVNDTWVTDAATLSSGGVVVTPAPDWSGPINISVDATATNIFLQEASTNNVPALVDVVPVADGPSISLNTPGGDEDTAIPVDIGLALQDTNGTQGEQILEPVTVTVGNGATLSAGTDIGGGVYELTLAELVGLTVTPALNDGSDIPITIQASTVEPANGDTAVSTFNGVISVNPAADAPALTVADSTGDEDTAIALAGLSAALVDTDGSEVLSVTLSGLPDGSILSAGSNNGDGSWTLTAAQLAGLALTPPPNFSGDLALTLTGFTVEENGTTASTSLPFTVTVNPVADSAVITTLPQSGDSGEPIALNLNVAPGDTRGTVVPGENPAETTEITLSGLVPGLVVTSTGGSVSDLGGGNWLFTGTAAEANTLAVIGDGVDGEFPIGISVVMVDGVSTGTPVTGSVDLTIDPVADQNISGSNIGEPLNGAGGNDTITGLGGNDIIIGGAGDDIIDGGADDDQITGGLGADTLTGGAGADTFIWDAIDILSGATDQITDFNVAEGDVLDLSGLLENFNSGTDTLSDFVNLDQQGLDTVVQIDQAGTATFTVDVATLTGTSGLDVATLQANGNLVA